MMRRELLPGISDIEGKEIHRGDEVIVHDCGWGGNNLRIYYAVKICSEGQSLHLTHDKTLRDVRRAGSRYVQPQNIDKFVYVTGKNFLDR